MAIYGRLTSPLVMCISPLFYGPAMHFRPGFNRRGIPRAEVAQKVAQSGTGSLCLPSDFSARALFTLDTLPRHFCPLGCLSCDPGRAVYSFGGVCSAFPCLGFALCVPVGAFGSAVRPIMPLDGQTP